MFIDKGFLGSGLRTYIFIFFLIILVGIAFFYISGKLSYNKDVNTLYSIADKLGYTPKNDINFRRIYSWDPDSSYDLIQLIYTYEGSFDDLSSLVKALGFSQEYYFGPGGPDYQILELLNLNSKSKLTLGDLQDEWSFIRNPDLSPTVVKWVLKTSFKKTLTITYLRSNSRGDIWKYNGKDLKGNVLVVKLNRAY